VALGGSFDYGDLVQGGQDIRFIDDDGETELAYHIDNWNPSGMSNLWVEVPVIDGGSDDDRIWMYYGSPGAPDVQDPQSSFDEHHAGVWHLQESGGEHIDSAAGISCTWDEGMGDGNVQGKIARANDFRSSAVDCGTNQVADTAEATITAWVNLDLSGDANQEVVALESEAAPFSGLALYVRRSDGAVGKWLGGGYLYGAEESSRVAGGEWAFVAIRTLRDAAAGTIEVSVDAGPWETLVSGDTSGLAIPPDTQLMIGSWPGVGNSASVDGRIDEVRISRTLRSDDWIRAQFLTGNGPFASLGEPQTPCE
jgi:hypothetical protein